jgi:high-affinity Fe2+/Pb2+ permease
MQFSRLALAAATALVILAYFGALLLVERFLVLGVRSYIIAAIVWLLCLALVRKR